MAKSKPNYYDNVSERAVKVIPLGGLERVGMNITAFRYNDSIIVVDCGLAFPEDDMPGIDLVVPDITYLKQNADKVKAFFITHGHDDHIGAIPYVLNQLNVPVYGMRLTMAIIEGKLEEHGMLESVKRHVVDYGDRVKAGDFEVEFIRVNHSLLDSAALAIKSPAGTIVHTGDFKIDYTPVYGKPADLTRFAELGSGGVLALLSDSTNAIREGFTPSERNVAATFDQALKAHPDQRIIVSTFASHIDRVQQAINAAVNNGRKVAINGRSMVTVMDLAKEMGLITFPDNVLVDIEQVSNYRDKDIVIIMTGSQGESMAALSRAINGTHRFVNITSNDVVIFSSSPIPGNEKAVSKLVNLLAQRGAVVINREVHVSGHACREELKLMYALTRPQYAVPLHGEFRHRKANADIAAEMNVDPKKIFLLNSGDVLTLSKERGEVTDSVPAGGVMVDGLGVGDVGNIVLRDRQNLAKDGIIVVCLTLSKATGEVLAGPEMLSRGFVYIRENENLMDEAKHIVRDAVESVQFSNPNDWSAIKAKIREQLSSYFWNLMRRSPMILPILMEVD